MRYRLVPIESTGRVLRGIPRGFPGEVPVEISGGISRGMAGGILRGIRGRIPGEIWILSSESLDSFKIVDATLERISERVPGRISDEVPRWIPDGLSEEFRIVGWMPKIAGKIFDSISSKIKKEEITRIIPCGPTTYEHGMPSISKNAELFINSSKIFK